LVSVNCLNCETPFSVPPSVLKYGGGKYCSRGCYNKNISSNLINHWADKLIYSTCQECGKQFQVSPAYLRDGRRKYCSLQCYNRNRSAVSKLKWSKLAIYKQCKNCGKTFRLSPYRKDTAKFCSYNCFHEFGWEDEPKKRQAKRMKGNIPWNKGKRGIYSAGTIEKIRSARLRQKILMTDTSIEIIVRQQLEKYKVLFEHPFNLGDRFQCDFYVPILDLIVECDGEYWHNLEENKKRDKLKDAYAKKCGFDLIRLKEHQIKDPSFDIMTHLEKNIEAIL